MRTAFQEIVTGWALDGMEALTDRIERAADWTKTNCPLEADEEATVKVMIESQIAKGIRAGDFEPFIPGDAFGGDEDEDAYDDPGISDRARI